MKIVHVTYQGKSGRPMIFCLTAEQVERLVMLRALNHNENRTKKGNGK